MTAAYVFFYILFSIDTWRILMGFVLSVLVTPHILPTDMDRSGSVMLFVMVACIGWTISGKPARWIAEGLKRAVLGGTKS
jgi:hypothetical protein